MKIRQKLITGYLLIALLVGLVGFISVTISEEALKNSIEQSSVMLAHETMENIDRTIYSRMEELKGYSRDFILKETVTRSNNEFEKKDKLQEYIRQRDMEWVSAPKSRLTPFMQEIMNNDLSEELKEKIEFYETEQGYSVFHEIYVTNRYGVIVASTGRTSDYLQADEAWYQEAVAEKDVWVGGLGYDESSESYSTDIVINLYDDSGAFTGIIKGVLNIEEVINILRNLEPEKGDEHEDNAGMDSKLLNREGEIIYASEEFQILQDADTRLWSALQKMKTSTHKDFFTLPGDTSGEGEEFIAHHHSKGYMKYKGLGWILLLERETKDVFVPVKRLRNIILIVSLIVTLLAAILGIMISRSISRPIEKLKNAARKVGDGEFDARAEVECDDEIGQLAADFNQMTESLMEITVSRDDLGREVAEHKETEEKLRRAYLSAEETQLASLNIMEDLDKQKVDLEKQSHDLGERVKELNCIYGVFKYISEPDMAEEDVFQSIINLIPQSWQYPEITCGRIILEGQEFKTDKFEETVWKQTADIWQSSIVQNYGLKVGTVEVRYLQEKPELYEGPFLKEERALLNALAREIGKFLERRRAEESLLASEEKYRSLSESIAELVYRADPETLVSTYVNKSVEAIFGYAVDEWLEDSSLWEKTIHPDDIGRVIEVMEEAKKSKEASQIEYRIKRKDGIVRWVEDRFTWEKDEEGKLISLDGLVYDITERKEMEEDLIAAKRAAEEASRLKSDFLARMSHELRTPLNAIIGFSGVLLQGLDGDINEQQQEDLTYIANGGRHLLDLVNDILDIAKIEAKKIKLEPINFKLRHTLSDTINELALRASQNGVALNYDIPRDLPDSLVGDPGRLRQILVNLIGNSLKFTEHGEINLSLEVESESGDDINLHFIVADTGIGIAKEKLDDIFGAFEQADNSTTRKFGGTGLGLSIAQQLVELMGGRIWVESEVGKGSRFHFIARFKSAGDEAQTGRTCNTAAVDGLHVLVVDDNASNGRLYKEMLKYWRMRPEVTQSGHSVLEMMSRAVEEGDPFHLLLLDRNMPEMDSFDLAGKIKDDPALAESKLIMLTSSGLRGDAARCRELGIFAYLSKPVSPSSLLDTIMTITDEPEKQSLVTRHSLREKKDSLNILLAEDNAVNRKLVSRHLEKAGHRVHMAVNGKEALAALEDDERETFHIILMDVQMPVMGGFDATAAIREKEVESGEHIPIVALTAHAMKGDRELCIDAGMDDYVSKPIDPDELFAAMDRVLPVADKKLSDTDNSKEEDMDEEVLDREGTLESFGGDADLLAEIIDIFLKETPKLMTEIHSALSEGDSRKVEHAAHSLKGSVSNFGARHAIDAALRMEHAGRDGILETADELYSSLEAEIERLVPELTQIVNENATT